jgi:hypothetical protein
VSIDPSDPATFAEDAAEDTEALDQEVPEADAAEQRAVLASDQDDPLSGIDVGAVDPADAVDQARVAGFDEDERP